MSLKQDLLVRLANVKPTHGGYRKAQDCIVEIQKIRRERDDALSERTSLLDRIAGQKKRIEALESELDATNARSAAQAA